MMTHMPLGSHPFIHKKSRLVYEEVIRIRFQSDRLIKLCPDKDKGSKKKHPQMAVMPMLRY